MPVLNRAAAKKGEQDAGPASIPPEDGAQSQYETIYIRRSSLVKVGEAVLDRSQVAELTLSLKAIQDHFRKVYAADGNPSFAMDVEFKFDSDRKLVVKQARPWVD